MFPAQIGPATSTRERGARGSSSRWRRWGPALAGLVFAGAVAWGAAAKPLAMGVATPAIPKIVWPTPNPAFMAGGNLTTWAQDTGTGDPHSGLFGCVRDDGHHFHEGIDIKCIQRDKKGEPLDEVSAAMDGQVAYINSTAGNSNYGRYIVLEHPQADVDVYTLYAHLAAIEPGLKVGQQVTAGQHIARLGHSGTENIPVTRAHLHFEIGLRLTDNFQPWYAAKHPESPNLHGLFNGENLIGMDPQAFFEAVRDKKFTGFRDYFRNLPTAFTLRISTAKTPDLVRRYPALLTKPLPAGQAGWDIDFTWYGEPKQITPVAAGTIGLGPSGAIALVSYDRAKFTGCMCRDTLVFNTAKPTALPKIGTYELDILKMMFGFK